MAYYRPLRPHVSKALLQPLRQNVQNGHSKGRTISRPFSVSRHDRDNRSAFSFTPANRLSHRTCMITGGTSGIGFAIAERFLQEGAGRVILVGRSHQRLCDAAARLQAVSDYDPQSAAVSTKAPEGGMEQADAKGACLGSDAKAADSFSANVSERITLIVGDVAEAGSWMRELEKQMVSFFFFFLESVDILVNAAGISISAILPKTEPSDISQILRTNLEGSILMSRALVRAAIRSRIKSRKATNSLTKSPLSKCIINVSSLLALKGGTGAVSYAASKAGILGLTRSLTVEAAASLRDVVIRSNAIVPGYIETPMIADFTESEISRLKENIPLHRFGDPQEIADAAVFLAQNEYANNCVLNIDGGLSAL
ncbi:hypothetical protein ASPZODRAFT_99981 [Penicilliopsis zonata CBS 506.65]|uniref:Ketoreductase domain-containing protein n=1 Tax=Penicilliopsis zonata CBS 506.65 TaxID=1073090 RepID=A0A1L9SCT7_9EURO|nr:hypothetical protein ASPZODRAFT_99981 [Penicilliopsis zonata CBS 506.65]OJJ44938.1 hypothetical protein ASPZODRAFT_99981 [Penicilliopsis zonata CBS 506.65]